MTETKHDPAVGCPTRTPGYATHTSLVFVNYGAGTNSTAMLVEMVNRGEAVDVITFADTGGERPETYAYVVIFSAWLQNRGYPAITTVRKGGNNETLEEFCLRMKSLPSIVFGYKRCSLKFKAQPQEKFTNNFEPAKEAWKRGEKITKCLGFDADEPHRAKFVEDAKYKWRYPLLEYGMGREECVETIKQAGLPLPGKSACFFCPNSRKQDILRLPIDLQHRAIEMERNAQAGLTNSLKGLGRTWKWEDLIRADAAQMKMFECNTEMPCECIDGA